MMVEKCKERGFDVSFCAIYGSSDEPELKYELFQKNNASFILKSIQELPKALNLVWWKSNKNLHEIKKNHP